MERIIDISQYFNNVKVVDFQAEYAKRLDDDALLVEIDNRFAKLRSSGYDLRAIDDDMIAEIDPLLASLLLEDEHRSEELSNTENDCDLWYDFDEPVEVGYEQTSPQIGQVIVVDFNNKR